MQATRRVTFRRKQSRSAESETASPALQLRGKESTKSSNANQQHSRSKSFVESEKKLQPMVKLRLSFSTHDCYMSPGLVRWKPAHKLLRLDACHENSSCVCYLLGLLVLDLEFRVAARLLQPLKHTQVGRSEYASSVFHARRREFAI
jgi:hypothetical protein